MSLNIKDGNNDAAQLATGVVGGVHFPKHLIAAADGSDGLQALLDALSVISAQQNRAASGKVAVAGSFAATGQSASFTPFAGREFNVFLAVAANTTQLERSRDGATWEVVLTPSLLSALPPSFTLSEPQANVTYRWNCTVYSAAQAYGFSQ